jgi:putative SOS response-associated peptidase YedK
LLACLDDSEKLNFFKMFNARSETVASKPIFKRLLSHNRCVVAYDGFYEWLVDEHKEKQPYFVHYSDNRPMLMAALYDTAHNRETPSETDTAADSTTNADNDDDPTKLYTYTVLTTNSSPKLEWLHDRMPVLLDADLAKPWVDPTVDASTLLPQLKPYNSDDLVWHPVTKAMNKVTYHGDDCTTATELTADTPTKDGSKPITAFFSKQAKSPQKRSASSSDSSSAVKAATPAASKGKAKKATPAATTAAASGSAAKRAKTSSTSKASPVKQTASDSSSAKHSVADTATADNDDADIQEAVARSLEQQYNSSNADTTARDAEQHDAHIEFERQMQQAIAASIGTTSATHDTTTSTTAAATGDVDTSSGSKRKATSVQHTSEHDEQRVNKAVKTGNDSTAPCTNSK